MVHGCHYLRLSHELELIVPDQLDHICGGWLTDTSHSASVLLAIGNQASPLVVFVENCLLLRLYFNANLGIGPVPLVASEMTKTYGRYSI